jgi:ADP-ribose pyrophosphatase YjhB (NUDIX family)/predicted transcriptional regulator
MSYEASAHEAQMKILRHLLLSPSAGFAKLQKQTSLSSDHFNFHIKKLVEEGYIVKNEDEKYVLTRVGKEYANRMDTDDNVIEKQPKLSVALIIENDKGEFLAQQRLKQPFYGFWGRPTGKIRWGEKMIEAAERELLEETGLTAELSVGGFYHKMDYDKNSNDLLEDKIFILIYGKNPKGELIIDDEGHHNEWLRDEDMAAKGKIFESVPEITAIALRGNANFMEQTYEYGSDEY